MAVENRQVILASRPEGAASLASFRFATSAIPTPADGEVLVRTRYLSIDPYLLRVIKGMDGYGDLAPGDAMFGRAISEVVESHDPRFAPGEMVHLYSRWQDYFVAKAADLKKIDAIRFPASAWLGVLGRSALTAWAGLLQVGQPKAGETVVVSTAAGTVGSIVGQIAKIKGCRAVGIAGGAEKCAHVVNDLGFDACVDYKSPSFADALAAALTKGADVHFENASATVLDAVLPHLNRHARIPLCGLVAHYGSPEPMRFRNFDALLTQAIRLEGFAAAEYAHLSDDCERDMMQWLSDGRIKYRETISDGLETAPQALVDVFAGRNIGKRIVKVA